MRDPNRVLSLRNLEILHNDVCHVHVYRLGMQLDQSDCRTRCYSSLTLSYRNVSIPKPLSGEEWDSVVLATDTACTLAEK